VSLITSNKLWAVNYSVVYLSEKYYINMGQNLNCYAHMMAAKWKNSKKHADKKKVFTQTQGMKAGGYVASPRLCKHLKS
jgi:hypothetical protein